MVSLPAPRITQAGTNFLTGQQLGRQQGFEDQDRQTMMQAGEMASAGDLAGASKALFKGGQFDKGLATKNAISKMSDDNLARTLQVQDRLARLAGTIETPEEFEMAKSRLREMGLPVPNSLTFEQLPQLRAEALSVADQMTIAMKERELAQRATARHNQLMSVSPGSTVIDKQTGQPVYKAPDKPGAGKKFTEGQSKAANFANMMVTANQALDEMAPKGPDGKPLPLENPKGFLGATRDTLVPGQGLRNLMTSGDVQAYNQTAQQWIRAKLRKESGAVIGEQEMEDEFRTYFPQYGDGPEVIARKAAARDEATKGMIAESGDAYQDLFSQAMQQTGAPPKRLRYNPETGELE